MEENKIKKLKKIIVWIVQMLLFTIFAWAGFMKIFKPNDLPFPWIKDNVILVPITGIIDLLAAIGILFPSLLNNKSRLTVYSAYGIIVLMFSAIVFHIFREEAKDIGFNIFIIFAALFIAWSKKNKL
ncbi:DoxX family protein [Flavobacterium pectinovorum]|uniref:DoxX-like family protein n=1 Tax=Flavobacterium pectinovorum TaxID=29533 RepID=A0AB36P4M5_9FLAO|nr:DoxX family protein [Flavobacterium pectinovorum]OXB06974.1 hypothetical protein B0A72_03760 [Flavobacterium pectinovorum]SHN13306.1 DoxX-like family protein [Flavobacterium pectinovorum]